MSTLDKSRYHAIQQHDLATGADQLLIDLKVAVQRHRKLQHVGMIAALTKHHVHIRQLDVGH